MMRLKYILFKFLSVIPYLIVFIASLYGNQDPDLGWHLKYGEYFFKHGAILRDNTFSALMPNFHWANGSWGTDVITYLIFHFAGFLGLTLFSSLIIILTFYFISKAAKFTLLDQMFLFPLLLYLEQVANLFPISGQEFSMLFIVILFWLINLYQTHYEITKKKNINPLLFTVPLFLIWANIHEEFLLALGLFFLWAVFYLSQKFVTTYLFHPKILSVSKNYSKESFTKKVLDYTRNDKTEILRIVGILALSSIATLINPFGIGIHLDALSHFGNPLLKDILQYAPLSVNAQLFWNHVGFGILLVISLIISYLYKKRFKPNIPILGVVVPLYILSFNVMRYAWPTYYLGIIFLKSLVDVFKVFNNKKVIILEIIGLCSILIIVIFLKQPFSRFTQYSWSDYYYCWELCSPRSAEFLQQNHLTDNLFSDYNWGGWLIWNYPLIKPTIDGRMHLWRDKNGYSGYADYLAYEQNWKDIDSSSYNVVYMSPDTPIVKHLYKLVNEKKWVLVYKDSIAVIFMRNTPSEWKIFANPVFYGEYLLNIGKINEATQQFSFSINQNPNQWQSYHDLAVIYQKEKNYLKAKPLEAMAIKNNPNDSNLSDNLATMIYLTESPENTINFTTEKLNKFPNDWKLNILAALGYYLNGNTITGVKYARKAYLLYPSQGTSEILNIIENGGSVEGLIQ